MVNNKYYKDIKFHFLVLGVMFFALFLMARSTLINMQDGNLRSKIIESGMINIENKSSNPLSLAQNNF